MTSKEADLDIPQPIRRSFFWAAIGQGSLFVLQFGSSVALARLLSPYELGIFAIALAAIGIVTAAQSLGLSNYLVRAEVIENDVVASVFTINLFLSAVISLCIFFTGIIGQHLFGDVGVRRVLMWLAWTPIVNAGSLIPSSILQRDGNFKALSLIRILGSVSATVATVAFALAGSSYMSLAYGQMLGSVVTALSTFIAIPRGFHWRPGLRHWKSVVLFGSRMLFINGVVQVQRELSNFTLGSFRGLGSLGLYSRANNLYNVLFDNIHTVLVRVILVDFAAIARSGSSLRERYLKVLAVMTAVLWPAFAGMAVLSGPMIHLLYGPKWHQLALPLSILCINGVLWVSVTMAWELFVVANETGKQARFEFVRSAVGLSLFVAGSLYSLTWAVVGRAAEGVFAVFLYLPHIRRITNSRSGDYAPIYVRSSVLTCLAIAPSAVLMLMFRWRSDVPLPLVLLSVLLGAVLWGLALFRMKHPVYLEMERFLPTHLISHFNR